MINSIQFNLGNENNSYMIIDSEDDINMNCSNVPKQPNGDNTESFAEIMKKPKPLKQNNGAKLSVQDLMNPNRRQSRLNIDDACEKLRKGLIGEGPHKVHNIKLTSILQALTTSKANAGFNLERQATIGDSFLKVAVSIYLFYKIPSRDAGRLTMERKALTSNEKLSREAKKKEMEKMITNTSFGSNVAHNHARCLWIPPMYKQVSFILFRFHSFV